MRYPGLVVLLVTVGVSSTAFGIGGKLSRPLFGYRAGLDADQQQKAQIALRFMEEELHFIDGQYVNQFVHHRFGGTSQQTSRFIELLNEAASWKVRVHFRDFGEQESAFTLDQIMVDDTVRVTVNSGRKDFRLSDFQPYLPKPPLPADAKQPVKK
jgi:hypothetical protein